MLSVPRLSPVKLPYVHLHPVVLREARRADLKINVGTIGHVAHGKSSTVRAVSGVTTIRFKNELERNITIKLGYANAKVNREAPS